MVLQILGVSMGDAFLDKNLLGYVAEGIQSTLVNIVPTKHVVPVNPVDLLQLLVRI